MDFLQARMLEWVAMPSSRVPSHPRDQTQVSHIAGKCFTSWATREAHKRYMYIKNKWDIIFNYQMGKTTYIFC